MNVKRTDDSPLRSVLVTGGAGYVGARLVPRLLEEGYAVKVLDLYLYGGDVLRAGRTGALEEIKGDIRDEGLLERALAGCDAVIHLACVSNDPSFELDPALGRSINYDCFPALVRLSREAGVRRFIYASTSSVYGVSDAPDVDEDHPLKPLTDYSRYKALCEPILLGERSAAFAPVVVRPATVCGWSPRLRLDLTVNILTYHALRRGAITVFGGGQKRPNIHIEDMAEVYLEMLRRDGRVVGGRTYNAGVENRTILEIAQAVRDVLRREDPSSREVPIHRTPTDDLRSYHISSERIRRELGFCFRKTVKDAVRDLTAAFKDGRIQDPEDDRYYNVRVMKGFGKGARAR